MKETGHAVANIEELQKKQTMKETESAEKLRKVKRPTFKCISKLGLQWYNYANLLKEQLDFSNTENKELRDEVFSFANKLALNGYNEMAVQLHSILSKHLNNKP
jgi:hypothetical protein